MQTTEPTPEELEEFAWAYNHDARREAALRMTREEVIARIRPYVAEMVIPSLPDVTFSMDEAHIYRSSYGY